MGRHGAVWRQRIQLLVGRHDVGPVELERGGDFRSRALSKWETTAESARQAAEGRAQRPTRSPPSVWIRWRYMREATTRWQHALLRLSKIFA